MKTICALLLLGLGSLHAQFAPAAGKPGSSALRGDSSCFVAWANGCSINRGWAQINLHDSGYASVGNGNSAIGPAKQNGVVSLGDGGSAILTFVKPIVNGPGWDFAVFENSFLDTFLELAFVEVSTDGSRFVRFPSESLMDTVSQTAAFGTTYPEKINNLAGKYIAGFGTPFDLEELKDSAGIDLNDIRYVRIIDVIGSVNPAFCSRDSKGRKINDPWPTPFPSSGFDLDAVGVINQGAGLGVHSEETAITIQVFPNPAKNGFIQLTTPVDQSFELFNAVGERITAFQVRSGSEIIRLPEQSGLYYLRSTESTWYHIIVVEN